MLEKILALLTQIAQQIEELPSRIKIAANQIRITTLSEISDKLGLIQAGEFRSGNGKEPGYGFSGMRMAYPPFYYQGNPYVLAGVDNDSLQFGLRNSDGAGVFAGGLATIGEDAINIDTINYIIRQIGTYAGNTRIGKLSLSVPEGSSIPSWEMSLTEDTAAPTELVTNGNFETGDFSGWNKTTETDGSWSITNTTACDGSYSLMWTPSNNNSLGVLTSSRITISESASYIISGCIYNPIIYDSAYGKIEIKWYDDPTSGNLLRTDLLSYLTTTSATGWQLYEKTVQSPISSQSMSVVITVQEP